MNPLISIVIPAYNAESFIKDAILSAINQTYKPFEIIVVDDGSTDGTSSVVESMHVPNLQLIKQSNGGVSLARNVGIKESNGEWIVFLDADDCLLPNCLEIHWKYQQMLPDNILHVGSYIMNDKVYTIQDYNMQVYTPWLPFFPKNTLLDIGGFDPKMTYGEDNELIINLRAQGYSFMVTTEPLYHYRKGINLFSFTYKPRNWEVLSYFFYKHVMDFKGMECEKEYYRLFIIFLFSKKEADAPFYYSIRKGMPFFVHPSQFLNSRIFGYILWYGSYLIPFDRLHSFIKRIIGPNFQSFLMKYHL